MTRGTRAQARRRNLYYVVAIVIVCAKVCGVCKGSAKKNTKAFQEQGLCVHSKRGCPVTLAWDWYYFEIEARTYILSKSHDSRHVSPHHSQRSFGFFSYKRILSQMSREINY